MAENKTFNIAITVIFSAFLALLIITFSIALPIYFRPFYYMQIDSLNVLEETWHTRQEVVDSYNKLLDYLTLPNKEFSTGVFKFSEEGKSHFEDCKALFNLNTSVLIISLIVVVAILILHKRKKIKICRPCGYNCTFTCGVSILSFFATLFAICSIDFDTAFTIFHRIFFPGKENFYFDPYTDGIILILPVEFFASCAILIGSSIILISIIFIIYGVIEKKKHFKGHLS